jgi:hypothetical protein
MAESGFAGVVSEGDVRFSQPVNNPVNTELNNSLADAVKGSSKVLASGAEFLSGMLTDDARRGTIDALEDFNVQVQTDPEIYKNIRSELKNDYKADVLNRLTNKSLRDLKVVKIRQELQAKYGSSTAGRNSIDQAMQDTLGYISPVFQAAKERRKAETVAASNSILIQTKLFDGMEQSNIKVPRNLDGTYNVARGLEMYHGIAGLNASINEYGSSKSATGSVGGGAIHNPVALAGQRKGIGALFDDTLGSLFDAYRKASGPEERTLAASNIFNTSVNFRTMALAGQHKFLQNPDNKGGNILANYNESEKDFLFSTADAKLASFLRSVGVEGIGTFSPENISTSLLKELDNKNGIIEAMYRANIMKTELGQRFLASSKFANDQAVKLLIGETHKLGAIFSKAGVEPNAADKLMANTLGAVMSEDTNAKIDPTYSLGMLKSYFSKADPTKDVGQWAIAATSVLRDGLKDASKEDRDVMLNIMDMSHNATFFKNLIKSDEAKGAELFAFYSRSKADQHEEQAKEISKMPQGKDVSLKNGLFVYNGSSSDVTKAVASINRSLAQLGVYKGIVPDKAMPDTKGLERYFAIVQDQVKKSMKQRQDSITFQTPSYPPSKALVN